MTHLIELYSWFMGQRLAARWLFAAELVAIAFIAWAIAYTVRGDRRDRAEELVERAAAARVQARPQLADIAPDGRGATAKWSPRATTAYAGQSPDMTDAAVARAKTVRADVEAEVERRLAADDPDAVAAAETARDMTRLDRALDDHVRKITRTLVRDFERRFGEGTGAELWEAIAVATRTAVEELPASLPDADVVGGVRLAAWQRRAIDRPAWDVSTATLSRAQLLALLGDGLTPAQRRRLRHKTNRAAGRMPVAV